MFCSPHNSNIFSVVLLRSSASSLNIYENGRCFLREKSVREDEFSFIHASLLSMLSSFTGQHAVSRELARVLPEADVSSLVLAVLSGPHGGRLLSSQP